MGRELFVFRVLVFVFSLQNREDFFFLFFSPAELNDWKLNSKPFINLQEEHVSSTYSIFP